MANENDGGQLRRLSIDDQSQRYPLEKMTQQRRRRPSGGGGDAGRMPPQAQEVEKSVLGAMLIEREAIPRAIEVLPPNAFYSAKHQKIYQAVSRLFERGNPVDVLSVTEELRRHGHLEAAGGAFYLSELTTSVASAANVEYHARIIAEKSLLRKMIETMTGLIGEAYDPGADAFELLDRAEGDILSISDTQLRDSAAAMGDVIKETLEQLEAIHGREGGITGVPSGFHKLDELTSGWQPSDLIIVAARPSMGKCLGAGTPVMMYNGRVKPVEEIAVGDRLMGDDGTPRTVQSLARGRESMYWVRQKHGMDYRVNESHILSLKKSRTGGLDPRGSVTDLSVREWLAKPDKWRNDHKGFKAEAVFPEQPVPLDPYLLGLWLGDDAQVWAYGRRGAWADKGGDRALPPHPSPPHPQTLTEERVPATMGAMQAALRALGVLGDKHIPHLYLGNARANRLRLLAGLIDAGGHLNDGHGSTYEITQSNRRLAKQIRYLCDTLGYRTSFRARTARTRETGRTSTVYRVRFNGNVDEIPVRIPHKKATPWTNRRDWRVTSITVEPDGMGDYYGFTLDGNGRFLLGDGTVTHNTAFSLACALNTATHAQYPHGVAIFSLEMGSSQLVQRMLTSEARVDAQRARTGRMTDQDWQRLARAAGKLSGANIFIDDTPGLSILELRAKCRRLKAEHDIGLIMVDYLQLMHGTAQARNANREQEIAQISRSLKALAKELNVPVIALSQLNRAVESRGGDKRPQLSDLRESGCLTGDTRVLVAGSGRRVPIRDLAGRTGFDVWAVHPETYRLVRARVSRAFSTGLKPVFQLRTQLGREIRATGNHKFLTVDGWKPLEDLREGEHVALPRRIPTADHATLTDDELALLGHLIGDGCTLPRRSVQYTTREEDLAALVAELARRVFGDELVPRVCRERRWYQVYLASPLHLTHGVRNPVSVWLDDLGVWGLRSHEKHVPEAVFHQPAAGIARFLRHLWATDGCLRMRSGTTTYPAIYYSSSSRRLARDVQSLLLRLGINARLKRLPQPSKGRDQYHVVVSGKSDALRFCERVGATGQYKSAALKRIRDYLDARCENTNRDVIPKAVWSQTAVPAMEAGDMTVREMQAGLGRSYCGSTLYRSNLSRERAARVADVVSSDELRRLARSDVYWDRVTTVEPDGEEEVFDLTVPGPHNFVAEDMFVHNSIEQDADIVAFIYRAERYGITVDEHGNSTEGIAEIIIGKQRNGPIGTVELAFVNQYARFENLTTYYESEGGGYGSGDFDGGGEPSASDYGASDAPRPSTDVPF